MRKIELNETIMDKEDSDLTYKITIIGEGPKALKLNIEVNDDGDIENETCFVNHDDIFARNDNTLITASGAGNNTFQDASEYIENPAPWEDCSLEDLKNAAIKMAQELLK